jgi:hypothetical protein
MLVKYLNIAAGRCLLITTLVRKTGVSNSELFLPLSFQRAYQRFSVSVRYFAVLLTLFLVELLNYVPELYFNAKIDAAVTANYRTPLPGKRIGVNRP